MAQRKRPSRPKSKSVLARPPWLSLDAKVDIREVSQTFLIVCEGLKTEPNYFRAFRVKSAAVEIEHGPTTPYQIVERAIALSEKKKGGFDQVWVVFDRDIHPRYSEAVSKARANRIQVAHSNACFEVWYLLHFDYFEQGRTRSEYETILSEKMEAELVVSYEKCREDMYELLAPFQAKAIKQAKKQLQACPQADHAEHNPTTTVHKLVIELNKCL